MIEYMYGICENQSLVSISVTKEIIRKNVIDSIVLIAKETLKDLGHRTTRLYKLYKYNKLTEYIHKWCWAQYDNVTLEDEVIPYTRNQKYNFANLIYDINYTLGLSITEDDDIIKNLKKRMINELSSLWLLHKNTLLTTGEIHDNIEVVNSAYHVNLKSQFVETPLVISSVLYDRLYQKLSKFSSIDESKFNQYIFCLIYRYSYIESGNQQLAISKNVKDEFLKIGVNFELFGSAINVWSDYYCSLFYNLEKHFGSKGSFFNIKIESGIYWSNPPYDEDIMYKMAQKIVSLLDVYDKLCFIVTIPVWDKTTQTEITEISSVLRNFKRMDKYDDYKAYKTLKKYIKDELIIPKSKMQYFNHRLNKYINASNSYILVVYNNLPQDTIKLLTKTVDTVVELYDTVED
jgi:hypothetical protein